MYSDFQDRVNITAYSWVSNNAPSACKARKYVDTSVTYRTQLSKLKRYGFYIQHEI